MRKVIIPLLTILAAGVMGCDSSSPNSPAQQVAMHDEAKAALERMIAQDPSLKDSIDNAYGYVIFPEVGEAAIGVGAANGKGFAYQGGHRVGTVELREASAGVQVSGMTYGELIIFQDEKSFNGMRNNAFAFGADAGATFVKAGAAGAAAFSHGVKVFVLPKGGLSAGVAITGQKFRFWQTNDNGQDDNQ